jgi:hypothetical protein
MQMRKGCWANSNYFESELSFLYKDIVDLPKRPGHTFFSALCASRTAEQTALLFACTGRYSATLVIVGTMLLGSSMVNTDCCFHAPWFFNFPRFLRTPSDFGPGIKNLNGLPDVFL